MSKSYNPEQEFSRRTLMAGVGGGIVWAGLVARLFQLQILEGEKYDELANENHIKLELEFLTMYFENEQLKLQRNIQIFLILY